jgi:hypothetical protein
VGILEDLVGRIETQSVKIDALAAEIAELRAKVAPSREIWTLADLAELPESPSLKTLRNCTARQPNGGVPDGFRGAQKAWYAETVLAWRRQLSPRPDTAPRVLQREAS